MEKAFKSWSDFWDKEAKQLCFLPGPLVGAAPVSVYCLQPRAQERLVFLNSKGSVADPQYVSVGSSARKLIYDSDATAPWKSILLTVEQGAVDEYLKVSETTRKSIMAAEILRYGADPFDNKGYHTKLGTQFRIQSIIPSPLYHDIKHWWTSLPRLGIALTLKDLLSVSEPTSLPPDKSLTSDSLLLICAVSAGNRILGERLQMIFTNSFFRVYRDSSIISPELEAARIIATRGVNETDRENWDKSLFLITNLVLAHHLFFPHAPEALNIFQLLGKDPNSEVLVPHGWDAFSFKETPGTLEYHIDRLVNDLMYLVRAINRWEHPSNPKVTKKISDSEFEKVVLELTRVALSLLCGRVSIVEEKYAAYAAITPPEAILNICKVTLPAFDKGQISHLRLKRTPKSLEAYSNYIKYLCPVSPTRPIGSKVRVGRNAKKQDEFNSIKHHEIEFSSDQVRLSEKRKLEWMGKYVRARLELELTKS